MSKLIGEPVRARCRVGSTITGFIWRKRLYKVREILAWLREPSEWWNGETMRLFVRVEAKHISVGTHELYKLGDSWFLHRVID